MTNKAGSKLKRAVKEFSANLAESGGAFTKEQKIFLNLNLVSVLSIFAEQFAEMDEIIGEIGAAVEEHEKFLEDLDDGDEAGIEPELADRLLAHLQSFASLIETSKAAWSIPETQMPPQMLIDKDKALADIAKLDAENATLLGAVKSARIDEDNPVVSIVNGEPQAEAEADDGDDDGDGNGN